MSPKIDPGRVIAVPEEGLAGTAAERALHERLADDPRVARVLLPRSVLQQRVAALARELRAAQPGGGDLHFVVVLKGALFFAKELGERLFELDGTGVHFSFLKASTYGTGIKAAGEAARAVAVELRPADVAGRDVVLVDDLVDQGFTLAHLRRYLLEEERVRTVRTCVLLEKRLAHPGAAVERIRAALQPEHVGFTVPDRWVAGYGIDAGEDFRNLPFIVTVNEAHYRP